MMRSTIYAYAWDLAEEGVGDTLARFRDAGLDGVALATAYHAGRFVRPHAPGRKIYFTEDGTVYFRPDESRYGRIRPRVNSLVAGFDAMGEIARADPDLRLVAWTVGLHNTPLGTAHPDATAHNAFGDPLLNSLCPSHPDVREYLVALCADIGANYPVSEVAIETPGWQAFRHGHHHEFELIELSPRVETMLGMCFCDACRTRAEAEGIDADGLQARTRTELESFLVEGTEPSSDPLTDPDWQAFLDWRGRVVASLIAEVRAQLNPEVGLAVVPTTLSPNRECWVEGSDLSRLSEVADRLEIPAYQVGIPAIAADVADVRKTVGPDARLGFILRPTYPNLHDAGEVADAVALLREAGAESIAFYNYGHMRLRSLDWIRAALS